MLGVEGENPSFPTRIKVSQPTPSFHAQSRKIMSTFLTAQWRFLVMLNYEIEPEVLRPFVPRGTELDEWNSKTFVSLVGFLFLDTRVLGVRIPQHINFEEVNLRFYVRRKSEDGWRRGVTFLREIVPRRAIAFVANAFYNERYIALPMCHRIESAPDAPPQRAEYSWTFQKRQQSLSATFSGDWQALEENSEEEFITEHYWGYAAQRDGGCMEYRVEHPRWRVKRAEHVKLHCDVAALYGKEYSASLSATPASAFIAEGSPVRVHRGVRI
jgi:uncharacterized protein YqjF (DUF2071 family)